MIARKALLAMNLATLELRLDALVREIERRYRPDQPRVPAGTPEGGRWTATGGSGRADHVRTALAARLVGQRTGAGGGKMLRMCTYIDMFGRQYSKEQPAAYLCDPTLVVPAYYGPY